MNSWLMKPLVKFIRVAGFYSIGEKNSHTSVLQEKVVQEKFHKKMLLSIFCISKAKHRRFK